MVVSITTLDKAAPGGQSPHGAYFMRLANPDYYTAGGEPPGKWYGAGAAALGLTGVVDGTEFANILSGLKPDGSTFSGDKPSQKLRGRAKGKFPKPQKTFVPGYDLCFSVPKPVSACWAAASPSLRKEIDTSCHIAVRSTLDWFAANIPLVRRGRAGRIQQKAELVVAMFDHGTSRISRQGGWEPQRHWHCIVANSARGEDSRWTAVNSRLLHEWARTLGPMFRATLAYELQSRLGFELARPVDRRGRPATWFELAGVPKELCKRWSSRRSEIEELLAGTTGLASLSDAKAREAANLKTRAVKGDVPPRGQLLAEWQEVAREFGLTESAVEHMNTTVPALDREAAFSQAWQKGLEELEASQSSFTYREAVQRICEAAQTLGIPGDWVATRIKTELHESPEIRPLGTIRGNERFATERTWQTEQQLLAEFDKLRSQKGPRVESAVVAKVLDSRPWLLAEQRQAVELTTAGKGGLRVISGVAGAGKSTTLDVICEAFELAGYQVIGGALAGVAKEELTQKAKIPARTIASYLQELITVESADRLVKAGVYDRESLPMHRAEVVGSQDRLTIDPRTIFILDEAAMVDTRTLLELARALRERGATLILVGDAAQLQPIGAGGPFAHLLGGTNTARLTSNLRQTDAQDRAAVELLRRGEAQAALDNFSERGRVTVAANRTEAILELVKQWANSGARQVPREHVVFVPTRAEAAAVNRLAQRERILVGAVDMADALANGDGVICRGDRVLFHKNVYSDGVRNGYRGEVVKVDRFRGQLTILLDNGTRKVTIRLSDYGPEGLTLAYAQTVWKGQGQTVEHAYLLVGGHMTDREMGYVQATRGRQSTRIFVDEPHAGEDLADLAGALARSRPKELAHDIANRARFRPEMDRLL